MKRTEFKKPPFEVWLEKQKTQKAKRVLNNLRKNPKLIGYGMLKWGKDEPIDVLRKARRTFKKALKNNLKRGSMTKPIPLKMREELANDPFMFNCCLKDDSCWGYIQWHHNLIYAGKRVNEKGAILGVCEGHHLRESKFKKELNAIMYARMTNADRAKYPRKKWL